ncbi:L-type lectin-domain containing receptor kinase IV.2 [Vitis vinifera]|uniref:L-type lectin-domain containing receptor kinase IV.2 n=1 Tax=Vitis vinifera TaxID=29760 RepID=A0A438J290_VITVI|nr:L-type lectin-domain containing receptor kinase IV.2 [Vitis vinifera]
MGLSGLQTHHTTSLAMPSTNTPFHFLNKNSHDSQHPTTASSFATTFVFAIVPRFAGGSGGHGFVFTVSPTKNLSDGGLGNLFGLFNEVTMGNFSNHLFAVEFDTVQSLVVYGDIDDNHVGIDINTVRSNASKPASYYDHSSKSSHEVVLESGNPIQAWIEYDGAQKIVNVTISPASLPKPSKPLLSLAMDLSPIFKESMYVGFSAATEKLASSHYILGWSLKMGNTEADPLDLSKIPSPPRNGTPSPGLGRRGIEIGAASAMVTLALLLCGITISVYMLRRARLAEGFKESQMVGKGGFGSVYKGVLPKTREEVAVKRISHNSKQGVKEFVAEIASLGKLRHRHLVHLQGWCKRKGDLLLVYDYMSNGSLDTFLFQEDKNLDWGQRFRILKEIAAGLLYLHEEWEQVVVHRDVKANNVLLDSIMNARLGDFGLAKLYEHGKNPEPPMWPLDPNASSGKQMILQDWVAQCHQRGHILEAADPKLGNSYVKEEIELVLKLGLLCSHPEPQARPNMQQVTRYLSGFDPLPEVDASSFRFLCGLIGLQN